MEPAKLPALDLVWRHLTVYASTDDEGQSLSMMKQLHAHAPFEAQIPNCLRPAICDRLCIKLRRSIMLRWHGFLHDVLHMQSCRTAFESKSKPILARIGSSSSSSRGLAGGRCRPSALWKGGRCNGRASGISHAYTASALYPSLQRSAHPQVQFCFLACWKVASAEGRAGSCSEELMAAAGCHM